MRNRKSRTSDRRALRYLLIGSSCALGMSTGYADDTRPPKTVAAAVHEELTEITVTATRFNTTDVYAITKIPERVIDTSQSIKVFSAAELHSGGIVKCRRICARMPVSIS